MRNFLKNLILALLFSAILFPSVAAAQSSSINVGQTVCDADPCASGSGGGGSSTPKDLTTPSITKVAVKATFNSAIVSWNTNEITLGKVSWGKNNDYADGEISKEQYAKEHSAEIINLQPLTQYFFKIIAFDQAGNDRVYVGKFLTLAEPDTTSPQNVSEFTVKAAQDRMLLSWKNPADTDFVRVRIVRSEWFYPLDPFNGEVVFEGNEQFVSDGVVIPGRTYYYAAFTLDNAGNYSSGALGAGMILWYSEVPQAHYPDAPVVDIDFPSAPGTVNNPVNFNDFTIIYNNEGTVVDPNNPQVPSGARVKLVIPAGKLPEGTKALTVTVKDQNTGSGEVTYLFALNKLTNEFFATIPALIVDKAYRLTITIFNSMQQVIQTVSGSIQVIKDGVNDIIVRSASEGSNSTLIVAIMLLLGLMIVIFTHFLKIRSHVGPSLLIPDRHKKHKSLDKNKTDKE